MSDNRWLARTLAFLLTILIIDVSVNVLIERRDCGIDAFTASASSSSSVAIHFIDVGWGDAIFINTPDKRVLIDGGLSDAGPIVRDYLINLNISTIDLMIATHAHSDHYGGLLTILDSTIKVKQVLAANESYLTKFNNLAAAHNRTYPYRGQTFTLSENAVLTVLNPTQPLQFPQQDWSGHVNNIVTRLQVGNTSFLFTGDANALVEQSMIDAGMYLQSDVLKVAIHGLGESTWENVSSQGFLDIVNPTYAVISCDYSNGAGAEAPDRQVLRRLLARNTTIFPTHVLGTIVASTDGASITFSENTKYPYSVALKGHTMAVYSLSWSPDGTLLASGSKDGTVRLWNTADWQTVRTINAHAYGVWSTAWSPSGAQLATGGAESTVRLWNPQTGEQLMMLYVTSNVYSLSWSHEGDRLAAGLSNGNVFIFNATTGAIIHQLTGHSQPVIATAWSPDGSRLASGSIDMSVRIWDPQNGSTLRTLIANTTSRNDINGLAWSPDGSLLAAAGQDGTVRVWDPKTGVQIRIVRGDYGWARGVTWAPDGLTLASTGQDCRVHLWEHGTGNTETVLAGHLFAVWSVAWSPDGALLASGGGAYETTGSDTRILIWNMSTPAASFVYSPSAPHIGETIMFNASASSPRGGNIVNYAWSFGDGNTTTVPTPVLHHTFVAEGNYTVILNVTDSQGLWSTKEKRIRIRWVRADVNGDGTVDLIDLVLVAAAYNSYPQHPKWNPKCDLNQDGKVNILDLVTVARAYKAE